MNSYQNRKYFIPKEESVRDQIKIRSLKYGLCLSEAEEEFVAALHTKITGCGNIEHKSMYLLKNKDN